MATYGNLPFLQQIIFFLNKEIIPTRRWTDLWHEGHDTGFMIAGAYEADLLADMRAAVTKAITQGTTLAEFRRDFDAIVEKHGWQYNGGRNWRTRVIYDTNLRTSYAAGRYAQMMDVTDSRPYWRYRHSDAVAHPRPEHLAWNGLVLRYDDPWWQTHYPPNGWGCQCSVETLSERDMQRLGKDSPDQAPAIQTYDWTDKATGEIHRVPQGIDPGWAYAPGASQAHRVRQLIEARIQGQLPVQIAAALASWLHDMPPAPPAPGASQGGQ